MSTLDTCPACHTTVHTLDIHIREIATQQRWHFHCWEWRVKGMALFDALGLVTGARHPEKRRFRR